MVIRLYALRSSIGSKKLAIVESQTIRNYMKKIDEREQKWLKERESHMTYIPSDKLINIPATPPYATALPPYVDSAYLSEVVSRGGTKALANLYGVSSVEKISSNILPKELANTALGSISAGQFNPLSKLRSVGNLTDISSFAGKVLGANSQLSSLTGLPFIKDQNIVGSVAAKFGSSVLGQSPLTKLVNNIGNPNAPPYTGSNPIIRTTLGMPPLPGGNNS
jgi:hypothetical protein